MIRAIYRDGAIHPQDKVPPEWHDGDELLVEHAQTSPTEKEINEWAKRVEEAASKISDEDHDRAMSAIAEHRAEAKKWARLELGLPE